MKSTKLSILALGFSVSTAVAGWSYRIQPLENLPGDSISLSGINDHDQIIGAAVSRSPFSLTAEIWNNGLVRAIPLPKGTSQYAIAINNSNTVVGDIVSGDSETAYVWHGKGITKLPELPGDVGSDAADINNSGEIVGALRNKTGSQAATWTKLGPAVLHIANNAVWSSAEAVNDRGDVVGEYQDAAATTSGFIDRDGQITTLPTLGGVRDTVLDINQQDQAVGVSVVGNQSEAVIWQNGGVKQLQPLPDSIDSGAYAINDNGQAVGVSFAGESKATLWNDGTPVDLTSLLPANSGWSLTSAQAINNRGQIVGIGNLKGVAQPFLLTPVGGNSIPLPSPLLIGATTLPLAIWAARSRRQRHISKAY